jgi:glycerol-3-phosphate acyltransferase PlsY
LLYLLSLVGGYCIGSIPTAYLLVRQTAGIDIREAGSGNVGGFNAFVVTNSKAVGFAVGIIDGLKGIATVLLAGLVVGDVFWVKGTAALGAILGHIYSIWLRFKGGRGLATACGSLFLIGVAYIIVWCTLWIVLFRLKRDIIRANILCSIAAPVILFVLPGWMIRAVMVTSAESKEYVLFSLILSLLLLLGHRDELKSLWTKHRK